MGECGRSPAVLTLNDLSEVEHACCTEQTFLWSSHATIQNNPILSYRAWNFVKERSIEKSKVNSETWPFSLGHAENRQVRQQMKQENEERQLGPEYNERKREIYSLMNEEKPTNCYNSRRLTNSWGLSRGHNTQLNLRQCYYDLG